jgi:hypothetical protein
MQQVASYSQQADGTRQTHPKCGWAPYRRYVGSHSATVLWFRQVGTTGEANDVIRLREIL